MKTRQTTQLNDAQREALQARFALRVTARSTGAIPSARALARRSLPCVRFRRRANNGASA